MKYALLFLLFGLVGCNTGAVSEFKTLESNRWEKSAVQTFEIEITETGHYDLNLEFSHVFGGMPLREIPLSIIVKNGDSEVFNGASSIEILDSSGNEKGDCTGDICDSKATAFSAKKLAAGTYTVSVTQTTEHEILPNVIGIGVAFKKANGQ